MSPQVDESALRPLALALLLGVASTASCELEFKGGPTELRLSERSLEILGGDGSESGALNEQLERLFGTAQEPRLPSPGSAAGQDTASLAAGRQLYERNCLHCHGNEGGGDGVTAFSLRPVPRDFRRGVFKYNDLLDGGKPYLADLQRVIEEGIEGSAMPSFHLLREPQLRSLAEYTRYLAIRGEVELLLATDYEPGAGFSDESADAALAFVHERWFDAPRERLQVPPAPEATAESVELGFELFHDEARANCASCHGDGGRGDGPSVFGPSPEDPEELVPALFDLWGHPAEPPVLTHDRFLFGEEPESLYARIYLGIQGSAMPGLGAARTPDGDRLLEDADLWALVHYVQALRQPEWAELLDVLDQRLP